MRLELVDLSKQDQLAIGLFGSDERTQARFDSLGREFDECRKAIRPLLLHSDLDVREAADMALRLLWPALNRAYGLRFANDRTTVDSVTEAWDAMAAAASGLAAAVRHAGKGA